MLILKQTSDLGHVKEEEYGLGQRVQFTKLDSCIGVCAKVNYNGQDQVIGIHLVHRHTDDTRFTVEDMESVERTLRHYGCIDDSVMVIGDVSSWEASNKKPLQRLRNRFHTLAGGREYQLKTGPEGGLGAQLEDGELSPVYSG